MFLGIINGEKIVEKFKNSRLLGVTATPIRTNGDGLGINASGFLMT